MTRWTHVAVVASLTVAGCGEPTETRVEYIMVQTEAGQDVETDAAPVDGPEADAASPDTNTLDAVAESSPDADSSAPDVWADAGSDVIPDAIEAAPVDAPQEAEELPDVDAAVQAEAGPGVMCPCAYASQCKCLSESSQNYPFEVTEAIPFDAGAAHVVAMCPPGEPRSDLDNSCWPEGDVLTVQPGNPKAPNGWQCAGWFAPQCTGCPVPNGTLTTRTRCVRRWCNAWAACQ